jgi:chloramphenicol-sensitive protein RarD
MSALSAFALWGMLPVYWKQLTHMGTDTALAQRAVWTMVMLLPLLSMRGELVLWWRSLRSAAVLRTHAWAALMLGINWGVFVWAAQHGRILECSLGYFINPLLNVLIGRVWLGERLTWLQKLSVGSAACGVMIQLSVAGSFPWVGLALAVSFALYALARRRSPLADAHDVGLIIGLGAITVAPLLGFAHGARELPFALLGLLQFLAPSGQFLLGAFVYGEKVTSASLLSFGFIWTGVLLFCLDLARIKVPGSRRRVS